MEFSVHEIGNYQFVETKGYVVACAKIYSKKKQIEDLQANYENLREDASSDEEAFEQFVRLCNMRKKEDWLNYTYDGHCTHLLEEDGFFATLPIKYVGGEPLQLTIRYWKEYEGEVSYFVLDNFGRWQGTIRNVGENAKEFFERFIGEVCFNNGILDEMIANKYFPFSSRDVRDEFKFSPGLAIINPVRDMLELH